jgi:hypothetical protein
MECNKCGSVRIIRIDAKCNDLFSYEIDGFDYQGYVPSDLGIGGGDYIKFNLCLECGSIQGNFPIESPENNEGEE